VLQFNKRDLADICSADEMNAALNRHNWPFFEASAVTGMGVFETLKGISRFTLMSLKKRLGRSEPAARPAAAGAVAPKPAIPPPAAPATAPAPPHRPAAAPPPAPTSGSHPQMPPPQQAPPQLPRPAAAAPPAPPPGAPPKAPPGVKGRTMDVLGELEKLRREAAAGPATAPPRPAAPTGPRPTAPRPAVPPAATVAPPPAAASAGSNGRGELSRSIELTLRRADFLRARRVLVSFQVEDDQHRVMDAVRDLAVDIKDAAGLEKLLLRLNIALNAKE
jgi:outer membrane biosynthesis protein TonB